MDTVPVEVNVRTARVGLDGVTQDCHQPIRDIDN